MADEDRSAGAALPIEGAIERGKPLEISAKDPTAAAPRVSEEPFRLLIEAMPQLVWMTGPTGHIELCNSRYTEYSGVSLEEALRDGWPALVHPEDRAAGAEAWERAQQEDRALQIEHRLRSAQGDYRWFLTRALPLHDENGRVTKWIGTSTDIHDRKRAEEAQAFLAEVTVVLASSLDYQETLRSAARLTVPRLADWCSIHLLGEGGRLNNLAMAHADPAKVAWAAELERRYPPDPSASTGVANVVRTGKAEIFTSISEADIAASATSAEHLALLRQVGFTSVMLAPLTTRGRTMGAIMLVSAESKRRYTQDDLVPAVELARRAALAIESSMLYRDAVQASRIKDEFLATVSHELRTPLNALLGWALLLKSRRLDEATTEKAITVIERNATAQVQLIEDLLDVSQIIAGKMQIRSEPVELVNVIHAAVASVSPAAMAKRIPIETSFDLDASAVSGDPARLQQVVWNLLSNAVKFTPEGGRVSVALVRTNSHAQITVKDTGSGIASEFLPYVFERFLQADGSTTRRYGGLGLGLAIVRHLTEMHGGTVRAESAGEGLGAAFTVTLPLSSSAGARTPVSSSSSKRTDSSSRRLLHS